MPCKITIQGGKTMNEAEFYAWLLDGGYDQLVDKGIIEDKLNIKQYAIEEGDQSEGSKREYSGTTEQQQGEQEDRTDKKEPVGEGQEKTGGGDSTTKGGEKQEKVGGGKKVRKHYITLSKNESIKDAFKRLNENDFIYGTKSLTESVRKAGEYLARVGFEKAYLDLLEEGNDLKGLTGDEIVSLAFLMYNMLNTEYQRAKNEGRTEDAEEIFEDYNRLSKTIGQLGTFAGRQVNAFRLFMQDLSNPDVIVYKFQKLNQEAIEKAKDPNGRNYKSATKDLEKAEKELEKTKAKAAKEVAKELEKTLAEDEELGSIIVGGKTKGISEEKKAKIVAFFDRLKGDTKGKALSTILPGAPQVWGLFVEGVKKLVVDGGIPLANAIARVYSDMTSSVEKSTLDAIRDKFTKEVGLKPEQVAKKIATQKKKEADALRKEKESLEKELEANRKKAADLKKKAEERVSNLVDKENAKLSLAEHKEKVAEEEKARLKEQQERRDALEAKFKREEQEAKRKAKEVEKALELSEKEESKRLLNEHRERVKAEEKARLEKQQERWKMLEDKFKRQEKEAERRRKEEERIREMSEKEEAKRIQAELKEAQAREKQLEKDIERLGKEILKTGELEALVNDIINEYLSQSGPSDTNNTQLIQLVKERFEGISDAKAQVIANKIRTSVVKNVRNKIASKYEKDLQKARDKAEGKEKKRDPKTAEREIDQFVRALNTRALDTNTFIELFGLKYGVRNLTLEDVTKIRQMAERVANAGTPERKVREAHNLIKFINSFKDYYFADLADEMWYADVLSPVLSMVLGTADVNAFYNALQVKATMIEMPAVALFQSIDNIINKRLGGNNIKNITSELVGNITNSVLIGYLKMVSQQLVEPTKVEVENAGTFLQFVRDLSGAARDGFLKESLNAFLDVYINDSSSFDDLQNPFKNSKITNFDIRRFYDAVKKEKPDLTDKKKLAYLYYLANYKVYDGWAMGWRHFAKVINFSVPLVRKTLAAQDQLFTPIIAGAYAPTLLREKLIKEGMTPKEADKEVLRRMINTQDEYAVAKEKAINHRLREDITFIEQGEGDDKKWFIYDNNKPVKNKLIGGKAVSFDNLEDAKEYARKEVAPKGTTYKKDVIYYLNLKMGEDVIKFSKRMGRQALLTDNPLGGTGTLLGILNTIKDSINKTSDEISESSKNKAAILKAGGNMLATMVKFITHMAPFLRVSSNLVRNMTNYITPIGIARGLQAQFRNKSLLNKDLPQDTTRAEVYRIYVQAIVGAAYAYTTIAPLIQGEGDDDDYKEEEEKYIENIEKRLGVTLTDKQKKNITFLKPGMAIGVLDFLSKPERDFYIQNNIFQENSIFVGYDEKGNRKFKSAKGNPVYAMALMISNYFWRKQFTEAKGEDFDAVKAASESSLQLPKQILDLSIGQALAKYIGGQSSTESKMETFSNTVLFDIFGIMNPNIAEVILKYNEAQARRNRGVFSYKEDRPEMDATKYIKGTAEYLKDNFIPVMGSWYRAKEAPLVYDMFGNPVMRVPSESQGFFSPMIKYYATEDKNLEEKAMAMYLLAIGYTQKPTYKPLVLQVPDSDREIKITPLERDQFAAEANKQTYNQIKSLLPSIQLIVERVDKADVFDNVINDLYQENYIIYAMKGKGIYNQEDVDRRVESNLEDAKMKLKTISERDYVSDTIIKKIGATDSELKFIDELRKNPKKYRLPLVYESLKKMGDKEKEEFIKRLYILKGITSEDLKDLYMDIKGIKDERKFDLEKYLKNM